MKHIKIEAFNIPDAWFQTITAIWNQGEHFNVGNGSEEGDTLKLDVTIHIKHPEDYPLCDDKAPTDMKHIQEYGLTYLYTDFLGEHPYTYGWRLQHPVDQKAELIKAILKSKANRQLTMTIRIPEDAIPTRTINDEVVKHEPPCLTMLDFEVLNGKVNLTCYFRSWDAYAGLPENIAGLYLYLKAFVEEINESLIANGRPYSELLFTGEMIFHSKNCHLYKRIYGLVKDLVEGETSKSKRLAESWKADERINKT
jgi:thymidylate synthase